MEKSIVVDIVMTTYNQEKYIAKAIESALSQICDFSYRLIIGEDFSTDGTKLICKSYADLYPEKIVLLENKSNLGLIKNYLNCFDNCRAKYIAILEGDDYWVSQSKLQQQVDFLQRDNDFGLVHANFYSYDENAKRDVYNPDRLDIYCKNNQGYVYSQLLWNNFICPLTVVFRNDLLKGIDRDFLLSNDLNTIDYYLWLYFSNITKVGYQSEIFGVYNIASSSISNTSDISKKINFEQTKENILKYILAKYPNDDFKIEYYYDVKNIYLLFKSMKSFKIMLSLNFLQKFTFSGLLRLIQLKFFHFK
jgi:glycosyltransferase involved in cell wall biosynthesis